jgi:hypothetical protein
MALRRGKALLETFWLGVRLKNRMRQATVSALAAFLLAACGVGPSAPQNPWKIPDREPRIHVALAGGCPASLTGVQDVSNPGASVGGQLAPTGPQGGLICRFHFESVASGTGAVATTSSSDSLIVYGQTVLTGQQATRLVGAIDAVSLDAPQGVRVCPNDLGSASIIVFGYTRGPDIDLWYHDSGCKALDNGVIGAFEGGNPPFYQMLDPMIEQFSPYQRGVHQ